MGRTGETGGRRARDGGGPDPVPRSRGAGRCVGPGRLRRDRPRRDRRSRLGDKGARGSRRGDPPVHRHRAGLPRRARAARLRRQRARGPRSWSGAAARSGDGSKRVVVAGAGPGGLEAARVAAESGHDVVLYERDDVTGGQLRIAAAGPTREELLDFVFYAERELARLGVDVRLGTPATRDAVLAEEPDLVVAATGAEPLPPEFPFDADARVVTVWDLLGGAVPEIPGERGRARRRLRLLARHQRGGVPGRARRARSSCSRPRAGSRSPSRTRASPVSSVASGATACATAH